MATAEFRDFFTTSTKLVCLFYIYFLHFFSFFYFSSLLFFASVAAGVAAVRFIWISTFPLVCACVAAPAASGAVAAAGAIAATVAVVGAAAGVAVAAASAAHLHAADLHACMHAHAFVRKLWCLYRWRGLWERRRYLILLQIMKAQMRAFMGSELLLFVFFY